MSLLNVNDAVPAFLWATVRLLATTKRPYNADKARALLTPPTIAGEGNKTFDDAISTLGSLGIVSTSSDGSITLSGAARELDGASYDAFVKVLREAVLNPELNTELGTSASQVGPRDLTRALSWFLTHDPNGPAFNWSSVERSQQRALSAEAGSIVFVNNTRWPRFTAWAPALGLAAEALPTNGQAGQLVPDCTTAVRQCIFSLWKPGDSLDGVELLRALREALPVLPGGSYSTSIGLPSPGDAEAGFALSHALLRGKDEGWLELERDADARNFLLLHDHDNNAQRAYSSIKIFEDRNV